MKIPLSHIQDMARHRPPGYYEDVLSRGRVVGSDLVIQDDQYQKLCRKYRPSMPKFSELANNFIASVSGWVSAGFPVVDNDTYTQRYETCLKCRFWAGTRCSKCGCFQVKMWLETERCPIGEW